MGQILVVALAFLLAARSSAAAADDKTSGAAIFQSKCASCHGAKGEGTKKHPEHLQGDLSVHRLVELIQKSMPEDKPGTLPPREAEAVAAYVYDEFYSPLARERSRPARIEVTRLTVRQYRNTLADLVGSFRSPIRWEGERGLRGEYYSGRRFDRGSRMLKRTDPQVAFDFKTDAAVPPEDDKKMDPHEFSIRWEGAVLANETGWHGIVVRAEHAARLWLNDPDNPLIDAWVKSGKDTEYKASAYLLAGRVYTLKLEFSKAIQGVNDKKSNEGKPVAPASITLLWKRPLGALEAIPQRQLSTATVAEQYVCATAFPPDDASTGWIRGTAISKEWDQAATESAFEVVQYIAAHLRELAGVKEDESNRKEKLKAFASTFAERAFRRPLTDEQRKTVIEEQFDAASDADAALTRSLLLVLKSPEFLYRELRADPDPYDVAARLSYGLWDSPPDQELLKAAAGNKLATPEQVRQTAERMVNDPRARTKLREFLLFWLKADQPKDLAKNAEKYPGFDEATISNLRTSLELTLDEVVSSEKADWRQLLLADEDFVNERLAKFFSVAPPPEHVYQRVKLDAHRAGVLTHPYLMASFAYTAASSPIHRGVFLARGVLGESLRPPPVAVAPTSPDLNPELTTRERVETQTKAENCMSCHRLINPLGFTLEHFDAVGRYREQENGKPINAGGQYQTRQGKTMTLHGARALAEFVAQSEESQSSFAEQLFHHLVQQPVRAFGAETEDALFQSFKQNEFNIRKLAVEIMVRSAGGKREPTAAGR